ncbi:MAG: hypothetical protein ABIK07_07445, partial [Planctomycetota bacterium]
SLLFDSNIGRLKLSGETMFPALSVEYVIDQEDCKISFNGQSMTVSQTISSEDQIDSLLTNCEHTLPSLLSVATGLAIFCTNLEICIGDVLKARSETLIPPNVVQVIAADKRIDELKEGIQLIAISRGSFRFNLASSYFREALYYDSAYNEHNPYTHSLITILKCAQVLEILFGSKRDSIREKCKKLGIPDNTIEKDLVRISLVRNDLGSGHASRFVPTPSQTETLRRFAHRSIHTIQQLLLLISKVSFDSDHYLFDSVKSDNEKDKLLEDLQDSVNQPLWEVSSPKEFRQININDPRLIE